MRFFENSIVLGLSRRVFPEKMTPELKELVPRHPFDAHGLSHCTSSARGDDSETFFLPQKKRRTEHGITAMLLGPAFSASGMPRVKDLREQGKKS